MTSRDFLSLFLVESISATKGEVSLVWQQLLEIRNGQKEEEEEEGEKIKSRLTCKSCSYQATYQAFFSKLVLSLTAHFALSFPLFPLDSFYTPSRILTRSIV